MHAYTLAHLSDTALLADLASLVATDRRTTAALLAHLAEVEARGLFRPEACSSMYSYCTRMLGLSEDAALKRIRAARTARRFPQIFDMIAEGRLHLIGVVLLGPHLTAGNVDELLAAAAHRSKAEIEMLVARVAPRPDLPTAITPIDPPSGPDDLFEVVPEPPPPGPAPAPPPPRVKPLSPERYGLQVTITQETRDKLERAKALMLHRNPTGDLAVVLDCALGALLANLEKQKFGATSRPRAAKARGDTANPRYTPNDVKREVHARDEEQCTFVSAAGVRCTERGFLELDHLTPVAVGGKGTVEGTGYKCHAHNQYEAERWFGADFMRAKRQEAAAKRAAAELAAVKHTKTSAAPAPAATAIAATTGAATASAAVTAPGARSGAAAGATTVAAAGPFDADVTLALCTMGFKKTEVRRAMADSANQPATTFEARIRAALAQLRSTSSRCSDGQLGSAISFVDGWSTLREAGAPAWT